MARIPRNLRARAAPDPATTGPAPSASAEQAREAPASRAPEVLRDGGSAPAAQKVQQGDGAPGHGGSAATAAWNAAVDRPKEPREPRAPSGPKPPRPEAGRRPNAAQLNAARVTAMKEGTAQPGVTTPGEIPDGHVLVARIGRAQGIRGQVTVEVHTDAPEIRLADGVALTASGVPGRPTVTVASTHWHSGRLLLSVVGVTDRTAAESLRGLLLSVPGGEADTVEAGDPDDFWDHQLVGLRAEDLQGTAQGTVVDVLHLPGGDTLVIDHEGEERLLPFLTVFTPTVDLAGKRIVVTPPEGLW